MITIKQLEHAQEIAYLRDQAKRNARLKLSSINKYGGMVSLELQKRWLHQSEISLMAYKRIDNYLNNYLKSLI